MTASSPPHLLAKYDRPVPRYTSYPAVPHWRAAAPTAKQWLTSVRAGLKEEEGISLYIHLPYCEHLCTYCACNKRITKNHDVERPYVDTVLREWEMYLAALPARPLVKTIHLGGGTPTFFSAANLDYLLESIITTTRRTPDYEFSFEAHPADTTNEHLATLRARGFDRISIGVQDFDPEVLRLINRKQTEAQVVEVTETARALGYRSINFDFVYGLPGQGFTQLRYNRDRVACLRPDRIAFYSYAHVPWRSPGQRAYDTSDLLLGQAKQQLYNYGKSEFTKLGYLPVGMDHFARPGDRLLTAAQTGRLYRNFMGYTDRRTTTTIGLGASAISDSRRVFVQNEHRVEAYHRRVAAGELPIVKGHVCNEEDRTLRRHILDLSCNYRTELNADLLGLAAWPEIRRRLQSYLNDELVELNDHALIVTPQGRPFVRNVCSAFDCYLSRATHGSEERYSRAV